jgi:hypothetical protein
MIWCDDIDINRQFEKMMIKFLKCTLNYKASKKSFLFFEINSLDVHFSNIRL